MEGQTMQLPKEKGEKLTYKQYTEKYRLSNTNTTVGRIDKYFLCPSFYASYT